MTDAARFLIKKKNGGTNLGQKLGFSPFSQIFLDIPQDSSLGQCLKSSKAETYKKNLRPKLGLNRPKSEPK